MSKDPSHVASRSWIEAAALPTQATLVVSASLVVAACAHLSMPLPHTPVPLTLQNFGVLLVGLALGSRRGFLALALYLAEGAAGLPVFSPFGAGRLPAPGGLYQLFHGPTSGYLLAYPAVAFIAGWVMEHGRRTFASAVGGAVAGEVLLFASGVLWLMTVWAQPFRQAAAFGFYPFLLAEPAKIITAAAIASRISRPKALS